MSDGFSLSVDVKNTADFQKIQRYAAQAAVSVLVGFPSGIPHIETVHEKDKDGNRRTSTRVGGDTADLARELSVGSSRTPPRPFLEEGIESRKEPIKAAIKEQLEAILKDEAPNWDKVGTMAVGAINEFVRGDHYKNTAPNSPEWAEIKGSDTPLIDGGNLIGSLQYIVEKK